MRPSGKARIREGWLSSYVCVTASGTMQLLRKQTYQVEEARFDVDPNDRVLIENQRDVLCQPYTSSKKSPTSSSGPLWVAAAHSSDACSVPAATTSARQMLTRKGQAAARDPVLSAGEECQVSAPAIN